MKQNKSAWVLGLMLGLHSCSEMEELSLISPTPSSDSVATRTDGDAIYDVLGYGYDATEEYMGENSTRSKVLDVAAFDTENPGRFDNPFLGVIDQRVYAGEDYYSFLKDLSTNSNFNYSIGSFGKEAKDSGFFSGTLTTGFESKTKYFYSSKYSFARAEVFKKQRKYYLNTELEILKKYLSAVFLEDLDRYSADKIVEIYGTHVLTNIIVGGKYIAFYKSAIIETNNRSEKKTTVSAGAKFNISKIGLDANGTWSKTEITEQNNKNSNWECHIKSIGGSTSGTSITLGPGQGPTFNINLGDWTKSVDDQHSRLVDVDWNATYPIYDLISDPVKKQQIKDAVLKYIDSKKVEVLEVKPMYQLKSKDTGDTWWVFTKDEVINAQSKWGEEYHGVIGYVLTKPQTNTRPMYRIQSPAKSNDVWYLFTWDEVIYVQNKWGDKYHGIDGYIYATEQPNTRPMYRMKSKKGDTWYAFSWEEVIYAQNTWGDSYGGLDGYLPN